MITSYKKIVVKIGSNVLTNKAGLPDVERIANLVDQVAQLRKQGIEVIMVSSGAVASGRSLLTMPDKYDAISSRQVLASIGQIKLINTYSALFEKLDMLCAQVLVTKEDFRDRRHYLNIKNCLTALLQQQVIPIVNENDVVSVTELMFTDNDELAGLIASMINAQALIILTNVDGIYDGAPSLPTSKIITEVDAGGIDIKSFVSAERSQFGRGGMITKTNMAQKVAQLGIAVHIANGTQNNILTGVLNNTACHTRFIPQKSKSGKKKWIAHSETAATGSITINAGARQALSSTKATSLLPVGIIEITHSFKKGDIIKLVDEDGKLIGLGRAEYSADKAKEKLGQKNQKPLVHYDYLYLQ